MKSEVSKLFKKATIPGLIAAIACLLQLSAVQAADSKDTAPSLKISRWQNGAVAAISMSFDDWSPDHWRKGLKLWEDYGFKVTLGITLAKKDKYPEGAKFLQDAFDAGHEIANHTVRHESFLTMTPGQIRYDLGMCNDFLLSNIKGLKHIFTVIYPEEAFDEATLKTVSEVGYLFGRSGPLGENEFTMVNDPYKPNFDYLFSWSNQAELTVPQWDDTTNWVLQQGAWLIEECHGIGSPGEEGVGWSPRPESEFREHYDHIKSFGDQIWVAPICDVGRYVMERNATRLRVTASTRELLSFEVETDLDPDLFTVPLTVEMQVPENWLRVKATQGGKELSCRHREDGTALINFDPNGGEVQVMRESAARRLNETSSSG